MIVAANLVRFLWRALCGVCVCVEGAVARSMDLGFFSTVVALTIFALVAGPRALLALAETMRRMLHAIPGVAQDRLAPQLAALAGEIAGS